MAQVKAGWDQSNNGKLLPLFKQTGVETIPSKKGNPSHVPLLTPVTVVIVGLAPETQYATETVPLSFMYGR